MKIAVITSIKAPYRTLQFEEICKNKSIDMKVYYTKKGKEDRKWETIYSDKFKEIYLKNIKFFDRFGTLNTGLKDIVKSNDIIVLGGYEKPTYILLSLLCRLYKKKYIIIFDGICCSRLEYKENKFKWLLKNLVIKYSAAIWGNGTVSRRYFNEVFDYPTEKIYNQYLTVDGETIEKIGRNRERIRIELRDKYGIESNEKVLHYSGRLVDVKNVENVVRAISEINNQKITLLITGDGVLRESLEKIAKELDVKIVITGFIDNQEKLFEHYYLSDIFILPSKYEPWGLVVNEAMFAGLPVLVSNVCGCSLDLVANDKNGYIIDPLNINDISKKIKLLFEDSQLDKKGLHSKKFIKQYTFKNSAKTFYNIIEQI